jgi:2-dehydropantoate 2-reductase
MKIAIVGTGAMGSIYAARLSQGGHEVWAIDTWADHVRAINENGLQVDGPAGTIVAKGLRATSQMADAGLCDLYVIATKAAGVAPAAQAVAEVMGPDSMVLTIQNGLGAAERIAAALPEERILLGVAEGFGAAMEGPGHARHSAMKLMRFGEFGGGASDRLEALAQAWRDGGFEVATFEDITRLIWEKFLCNVALAGPCTAFGCNVVELRADPERWAVALGCMREAWAAGQALGVDFHIDDPETYVDDFARAVGTARPSMLQDHMARRRSELDAINGAVLPLGRKLGQATPYNDTICAVLRAREEGF